MLKVEPDKHRVQWIGIDGRRYVGRVLRDGDGVPVADIRDETRRNVLIYLDCDGGHVFKDSSVLRPYPDSPIPEPGLLMMEGPVS